VTARVRPAEIPHAADQKAAPASRRTPSCSGLVKRPLTTAYGSLSGNEQRTPALGPTNGNRVSVRAARLLPDVAERYSPSRVRSAAPARALDRCAPFGRTGEIATGGSDGNSLRGSAQKPLDTGKPAHGSLHCDFVSRGWLKPAGGCRRPRALAPIGRVRRLRLTASGSSPRTTWVLWSNGLG